MDLCEYAHDGTGGGGFRGRGRLGTTKEISALIDYRRKQVTKIGTAKMKNSKAREEV